MILPNKYITITESFIGLSALILNTMGSKKMTIENLWQTFSKKYIEKNKLNTPPTFQKYMYVLEFMYLTNMVDYNEQGEIFNENLKP